MVYGVLESVTVLWHPKLLTYYYYYYCCCCCCYSYYRYFYGTLTDKTLADGLVAYEPTVSVIGVTFSKCLVHRAQVQVDGIVQVKLNLADTL